MEHVDTVIFGAGPAGLAAAGRLVGKGKSVIVVEKEALVGGISKTLEYKGYRFDLGGHRFFTKAKEVNELWDRTLGDDFIERPRLSRIYYRNRFFDYPVRIQNVLRNLGMVESALISFDYLRTKLMPHPEERTFEQWVSNRFGRRLFNHFFKSYTEKLWGIPCSEIQAEWAAQRIKGLSFTSAIRSALFPDKTGKIKTLIDKFRYPKLGPGMMYERMADDIRKAGGTILPETAVMQVHHENGTVRSVVVRDRNGSEREISADRFISSMPITELVTALSPAAPEHVLEASRGLTYRSFITASVILDTERSFPDTWIYVHSPEVRLGRIQNFKAWSPYMVADPSKTALGLEYFCTEGDDLWTMDDQDLLSLAMRELEAIGLGKAPQFVDGFVARVPKAYPVYDAAYPERLRVVREYLSTFRNLQPVGRYGMFKYNNMDHSILTGLLAAENVLGANHDIWEINADQEYHEEHKN
ncbi:MAG: NAD(P)/FAD-dependent oxidoreductase [Candidatus Moranbacteria bacterium]|nr:NAD(P)/FAD-dependent oxidoreductase [Candidatus Moranbacteria bacterium]